ncbi:MAG: fibronectin type III domain-containing protein, partial [Chitinispirillaceae bacterium]|nr:fibronectin type III domain-containing protein [Chitinispirillaceae bacterium]
LLGYQGAVTSLLRTTMSSWDSKVNYMAELRKGHEFVAVYEHSWPNGHAIPQGDFTSEEYIAMPNQPGGPSNCRFYNLFACSNSRYTMPDFQGGLYAWGHGGLVSIGSTKTGGMLGFEYFNRYINQGMNFGDAFKQWLNSYVFPIPDNSRIVWHYGMVLCGAGNLAMHAPASSLPFAPSRLTCSVSSATQIALTWVDNATNESGYYVERATGTTGSFSRIATLGANATSYASSSLTAGTTYRYRVQAYNAGGRSGYTNIAVIRTAAPSAPTDLYAWGSLASQVQLLWIDNASNETGFCIERASSASGPFSQIGSTGPNVTEYKVERLNPSTTGWFRVRAFNGAGASAYTATVSAATQASSAPACPSGVVATAVSSSQINLAWVDNATNEAGFTVTMADAYNGSYNTVASPGANATGCSVNGLQPNTAYFFIVAAHNNSGNSLQSDLVSAATAAAGIPAAPEYLYVSARTATETDIWWSDYSSDEDGFYLERATSSSGPFTRVATMVRNTGHWWNVGLTGGTTYWYRIGAFNSRGISAYSGVVSVTMPAAAVPAAPMNLQLTQSGGTAVTLVWTDNADNEREFLVERALGNGAFTQIGWTRYNDSWFFDNGLSLNQTYRYRVRASNEVGHSSYSAIVMVSTVPVPPEAPSNLTAYAFSWNLVSVYWYDNSWNEDGFYIERSLSESGPWTEIAQVGPDTYYYSNYDLAGNTTYWYRVRAFNSAGISAYSNIGSVTTLVPNPPAAPSNLTAVSVMPTQVSITWQDNSDNEIDFHIERAEQGGEFTLIGVMYSGYTSYTDYGVEAGRTYSYRVCATNGDGSSGYSNIITVTTLGDLPAAPSNLIATPVNSMQINLSWRDNASNESGYYVERALSSSGPWSRIGTTGQNVVAYSNTGLTVLTTYWYRVQAFNGAGTSTYSATVSAKTLNAIPVEPTGLAATVNSRSQITLTWKDNSPNETGFRIERALSGGSFSQIATVGANVRTWVNTGLATGTTYQYRVKAYNSLGTSGPSNVVQATTHANIAVGKTATASTQQSINTPVKGNDNRTSTRWCATSGTVPQWWKVDLGSSKTLSGSEVRWEKSGVNYRYKIETSPDNANWTVRANRTSTTSTAQTQAQSWSATARYVRITVTGLQSGIWASFWEFRVFGK